MKVLNEGAMARAVERARRVGVWIRRHPARAIAAVPLAGLLYVAALYPFTPSIGDIRKSKQESASVVLSADGKELAAFRRANRDWVKLSDISPKVTEALLATEDKRFHQHHGIDFVRTGKAVLNTLLGDVEGGSTLTQQLARNLYPDQIGRAQTVNRKIKEAITALKIEAIYSKEEILESYLNSVSFLYNAWGIERASRTYFDKPAKNLNELEAATLVGMLKGTAYYNPVMNPERALQRRNTVLAMMVKEGKLPQARFESLKAQPLKLDFERIEEVNGPAPHLTEYLRRWLTEWADKNDYNVYADGLVVRTTIDSRLQAMANQAVERQMKQLQAVADVEWSRKSLPSFGSDPAAYVAQRAGVRPFEHFWSSNTKLVQEWIRDTSEYKAAREKGASEEQALEQLQDNASFMADLRKRKTMLQTGFLALEPATGAVRAWVGSRDYAEDKFDHVQQARRQPGSTFKPFVYGAAFESGMRPTDTLMDGPVEIRIDRNQVWRPTDIDAMTNAPMTLREALARSKNTVTAQLMQQVGPARVASLARAMGVRESKLHEVPSLALGTSPVTLKEIVTAFGTIANGGNYIEPRIVTAVEDRDGNVLASFHPKGAETALSTEAAHTLLDVMRGVIDTGSAVGLRPRFGLTGDLAGKTGTTQDNTDGWFILMHPQLVAGAWVGFNDNRVAMRSSYWGQGSHNALLVVGDFTQQAVKGNVLDAKATFAAPRLAEQEKPLMDRMGDWWNSVFTAPPGVDPAAATVAVPETQPPAAATPSASHSPPTAAVVMPSTAGPAEVPVAADLSQRPPSFPRALEPTRPVETVPGTQVYRVPEQASAPAATMGAGGFTPQRIEPVARPQPAVRSEPTIPNEPPGRSEATPSESSLPIGEATGSATAAPQ
ncbi:MAG: penicillin-binding protein [Ramlibacter sp.]|jgi:penicillin-binding protein 1A|nr:penicillin-binding protein [Ramlibacter sp.]